jgi:hypothetical protein
MNAQKTMPTARCRLPGAAVVRLLARGDINPAYRRTPDRHAGA